MDGTPTGLHYGAAESLVRQRLRPRHRKTAFWLLQAMEAATLQEWCQQQREKAARRRH